MDLFEDYWEHTNKDYPVGVYYVDLRRMFMENVRPHWHEAMEIDLVRSGRALFSIGEEEELLTAGSAVWINRDRLHAIRPADDGNCEILSILFHPAYLFEEPASFLATKYYTPLIGNRNLSYAILDKSDPYGRRGLECVDAILEANLNKAYGYELETKSRLCALWLQLLEKNNTADGTKKATPQALSDEDRVKDAISFIHSHYGEQLSLDDIADSVPLSRSECSRCFKRATGMSPFDYLLRHRIYAAARLMQRSDPVAAHINTLSEAVGFRGASYFNRIFRKYLGCTPLEYRSTIKKAHRDALALYGISLARL